MTADLPLVSIIIITYNSSKYVLETLESAKAQTYQNIELIISDDGSQDETVALCEKWLADHNDRFVHSEIITVEKNSGIPANCNRGVIASKGEWVKLIAGDDGLYDLCVFENIKFVQGNPEAKVIQSLSNYYKGTFDDENLLGQGPTAEKYSLFNLSAQEQYNVLYKKGHFLTTPSVFFSRNLLQENGLFDERFRLLEDYPMFLKLTQNGNKIHLLKKVTVQYRQHPDSVMRNKLPYMSAEFAEGNLHFLKVFFAEKNDYKTRKEIFKHKLIIIANNWGFNNRSLIGKIVFTIILRI